MYFQIHVFSTVLSEIMHSVAHWSWNEQREGIFKIHEHTRSRTSKLTPQAKAAVPTAL